MRDIEVPWTAAQRAAAAEPLYRAEDQHYQFKYLPAFAVLAVPLGKLSLPAAKAFWFAVQLGLLAAVIALSLSNVPLRRRPPWVLVGLTCIALLKFYGHEIILGQMNLLFCTLVLLALRAIRHGREGEAGIWVALSVAVKPYGLIFVPWLAGRRHGASILSVGAAIAALLLLPAVVYGFAGNLELHRAWWRTVTATTAPNLLNQDNVSIAAMYAKWIGPGSSASVLALLTSGALLVVAALVFLRRGGLRCPEALEGSLLLTCIPLLSPQGWDYVFLLATPAIMLLVNYGDLLPAPVRVATALAIAVAGLSLFDVMGRASYATFMSLAVISVCYLVVIAGLATLRFRRIT